MAEARSFIREGKTTGSRFEFTIDELAATCEQEFQLLVEDLSAAKTGPPQKEVVNPVPRTVKRPAVQQQPGGGITWDQAIDHVGSVQRVCGPLASIRHSTDDVFLNLGRDWPNSSRFTIVIWDIGGVEPLPTGVTICVEGAISSYEGAAQIETRELEGIEVWG